ALVGLALAVLFGRRIAGRADNQRIAGLIGLEQARDTEIDQPDLWGCGSGDGGWRATMPYPPARIPWQNHHIGRLEIAEDHLRAARVQVAQHRAELKRAFQHKRLVERAAVPVQRVAPRAA